MATATTTISRNKVAGGSFLIEDRTLEEVFTPEDFTDQHQLIAQTTEDFARNEIVPNIDRIEHKDFELTRQLIQKASELGLTSVDIPEQYGGMELDKVSSAIIAERVAKSGSFSVSWGAHV
ncbi:MAG TPA: acyl-CoA dehydrogenase family protein, partial [Terriglobales bacterium]|nr:acyl-CoA dehydrogenase family protein [Terriglobales bacterium]